VTSTCSVSVNISSWLEPEAKILPRFSVLDDTEIETEETVQVHGLPKGMERDNYTHTLGTCGLEPVVILRLMVSPST
jgi:hypothetical protein